MQDVIRMTYDVALCHPDEITNVIPKSSGWLSYFQYLIRMTDGRCIMSSGWLNWRWYLIRMSYGNVIMSSGWHTLPFLSHPDEIRNFVFSQHAVALQCFRTYQGKEHLMKLYHRCIANKLSINRDKTNLVLCHLKNKLVHMDFTGLQTQAMKIDRVQYIGMFLDDKNCTGMDMSNRLVPIYSSTLGS